MGLVVVVVGLTVSNLKLLDRISKIRSILTFCIWMLVLRAAISTWILVSSAWMLVVRLVLRPVNQ